MTIGNPNNRKE